MSVTIPDTLPTLHRGAHSPGEGQACVMEYVSVLAGEKFSDHPDCTMPMIAGIARAINDNVYQDDKRGLLIPLIPRLLVANVPSEAQRDKIEADLRKWMNNHYKPTWYPTSLAKALGLGCCGEHAVVAVLANTGPEDQIKFLTDVLDQFDRLAGRAGVVEVTPERMARAIRQVNGEREPVVEKIIVAPWKAFLAATFHPAEEAKPVEPAKALIQ